MFLKILIKENNNKFTFDSISEHFILAKSHVID